MGTFHTNQKLFKHNNSNIRKMPTKCKGTHIDCQYFLLTAQTRASNENNFEFLRVYVSSQTFSRNCLFSCEISVSPLLKLHVYVANIGKIISRMLAACGHGIIPVFITIYLFHFVLNAWFLFVCVFCVCSLPRRTCKMFAVILYSVDSHG